MLNNIDDKLREIVENFAQPENKGELLQILKELKKEIIESTLNEMSKVFDAGKNDIGVHFLDKGIVTSVETEDKSEE